MSFPKYPTYKDLEEPWLESMPTHWLTSRVWTCFRRVKRTGFPECELLSVYRDFGVIPKSSRDDNFNKPSDDLSSYQLVEPGDLVINKMKAWQGSVAISDVAGIVSPAYYVYAPTHPHNHRYFHYLMRSPQYIAGYGSLSKGIRVNQWDLEPEQHAQMRLLTPPATEQQAIANFLDRETAKIDALVAEQRRLIELLKEKRQAVISHAVTKGLDPNAKMKPSGIEWLGDVPEHWAVSSLRRFATFFTGSTPARDNPAYWGGEIPWVKTGEINYKPISATEETITEKGLAESSCSVAPKGTLLMALYGQGVTRGRVAILDVPAAFNQACVAINPDDRFTKEFLHAFFVFAYPYIRDEGNETTQMNMNVEFVRRIRVVVPPLDEQRSIVEMLSTEIEAIEELHADAEEAIQLLQERRTALISAAVTGKIDVRHLANQEAA